MNDYQTLNHSKWQCKYHVVFIPKYRRGASRGRLCPTCGSPQSRAVQSPGR